MLHHALYTHHIQEAAAAEDDALRVELAAIGLSKEGVVERMKKANVKSVEDFNALTREALVNLMAKEVQSTTADDELSTIKAKTMYKMVEEVYDSKTGSNRKLLFVSSKQADLIARDPSAIDKMLAIFSDKQQPGLVINLLPSMIRCWMLVRPLPGDPNGEREGVAALDRFMAEHIIPLAEKTHAIILCSAVQPFCVLSESLSRMVKLVRARWGSKLPFTIISFSGHVAHLYINQREDATWKAIRDSSKVWRGREKNEIKAKIESLKKKQKDSKDFDMDLDPNGNNFIMVDSTGASTSYGSYNRLVTEIARKLAAELPSIAIKVPPRSYPSCTSPYLALTRLSPRSYFVLTRFARQTGKSKVATTLAETDASGIEVALSNMEAGTPVLLLDLTKRPVMPAPAPAPAAEAEAPSSQSRAAAKQAKATTIHPLGESAGPAVRRRQIEWYREQVEEEESRRVKEGLPDYDWDVCMIAHFHDGAPPKLEPAHRTRTYAAPCTAHVRVRTRRARHSTPRRW